MHNRMLVICTIFVCLLHGCFLRHFLSPCMCFLGSHDSFVLAIFIVVMLFIMWILCRTVGAVMFLLTLWLLVAG